MPRAVDVWILRYLPLTQLDGYQDTERPWAPCASGAASRTCRMPRVRERRTRISASIIYGSLRQRSATIPTFSLDGGVILRPSSATALCAYGHDGSIDDAKALGCGTDATCVPGCSPKSGGAPQWCSKANPHDDGAWMTCGMTWSSNGQVRPWKVDDFGGGGGFLDLFAQHGEPFTGVGHFVGYVCPRCGARMQPQVSPG